MALLYWLFCFSAAYGQFIPATYPAQTPSECGTGELLVDKELMETIEQVQQQLAEIGLPGFNPPTNKSCQQILSSFPSAPSGYYQIASNGSPVQVYCDMGGTTCGGGGWMRVAFVNMKQSGTTCPQGLTQRILNGKKYCGRSTCCGCQSTVFPTHGFNYSHVCGQLRGYQYGGPDAFYRTNSGLATSVDDNYVDGASITYGADPRKHIWTYAAGTVSYRFLTYDCPCNAGSSFTAPSFICKDYYCESGIASGWQGEIVYNDTLWDGQQCPSLEIHCCTHPNMPWFQKTLNETTTENIELRLCGDDSPTADEDVLLELIELYVR